jgi:hypothetical protein
MYTAAALSLLLSLVQQLPGSSAPAIKPEQILEGALSGAVREALIESLAGPPYPFANKWGNQITIKTPDGGHWVWEGVKSRFETHYREDRLNHGLWIRGTVALENPAQELFLNFSDFSSAPRLLEVTFKVYARAMFRANAEVREYNHGAHLFSVNTGARAVGHLSLTMKVYLTANATKLGWQVVNSDLSYSDVTLDRVGTMGGESAKIVGDAMTGSFKQFFASKREKMLADARTKISNKLSGSQPIRNELARVIRMAPH